MTGRRRAAFATVAAAAVLAGCGGSGGASSTQALDPSQVQVATSEKAHQDGATVSTRLRAAGYNVVGSTPTGGGVGAFAVTFDGGGVLVVLVLDSSSQAALVADSFRPTSASPDALVQQIGTHVYAANTLGSSPTNAIGKADFDKLVAAGEGSEPG
jgi:hypothetical protein